MFFIGIFGIDSKEKEIKNLINSYCKKYNISSDLTLIKSFTFFHFFFIPLFKWNEVKNSYGDYYSVKRCSKCNKEVENGFEYCPYCGEKIK